MAETRGMLTLEALREQISSGEIDTVLVVFTDLYGRFMGKRYDAEYFLERVAQDGSHACDYLLTVDIGMTPVAGYDFANWDNGYGDVHLAPDLDTLRRASWLERTALVLCDVIDRDSHERVAVAPRTILQRQVEAVRAAGFEAIAATELEFYVFEDSYREALERRHHDLRPIGWYIEDYHVLQGSRSESIHGAIRRHLRESGVPVESSKGEWGKGQHEINVRYADALTMADRHVVYKQCVKESVDASGRSATFMAKFAEEGAGSGCHIHLSLAQDGGNAFAGDKQLGRVQCSDVFRWFLGGWIRHAREMSVFYAPNVNSYKRYMAGSWAPTRLAWSYDNRTAGFRVVGSGPSLRIECRIPGADCNPYLALAASLASGLAGITQQIEPPPIFEGDVYGAQDAPRVPHSLSAATDRFEQSEFARLALGAAVVEHYTHFFRTEAYAYERAVTDWERRRYFEQI